MNLQKESRFKHFQNRKRQHSESCYDQLEDYFNKRFSFNKENDWVLPKPDVLFTTEKWSLKVFQDLKEILNNVKGQLNEFVLDEWSDHTRSRDPAGYIYRNIKRNIKPELLTQAWCKFYECISQYPLISDTLKSGQQLNTFHLCEAPGAFICALNHYLKLNYPNVTWNWKVNSLNPDYEGNEIGYMIADKRLLTHTRAHWVFGADRTGDITQHYNYEDIVGEAQKFSKILLVTADGSIDCMSNPGEQETLVERLIYCEIISALSILSEDGNLVIKFFTMFESSSICLLYLLNNYFEKVHVFKPCSSKSGNSEHYVICIKYTGKDQFLLLQQKFLNQFKKPEDFSIFPKENLPTSFLNQLEDCAKYFMNKQIRTIKDNIYFFKNSSKSERRKNEQLKVLISEYYLKKYELQAINENKRIVKNFPVVDTDYYFELSNFERMVKLSTKYFINDNKIIQLEFEIGKRLDRIFYSNLCDYKFIQTLLNQSKDFTISSNDFNHFLENLQQNYEPVKIDFIADYNLYFKQLFQKLLNIVLNLKIGTSYAIISALFLTHLDSSLLFIFVNCFSTVRYFPGVIFLGNAVQNIEIIKNFYKEIELKLNEVENMRETRFQIGLLNILPPDLISTDYNLFLKNYNDCTFNYIFNESNKCLNVT